MPEFSEFRYGELEYREDGPADDDYIGKSIGGTILRYGDEATFPWGKGAVRARRVRGCFQAGPDCQPDAPADASDSAQRRGRQPSGQGYADRVERQQSGLLNNSAGRDTVNLDVRMKILRGQSIEFQGEHRPDSGRHPGCQRRQPVWAWHCRQARVPRQQGRHPCGNALLGGLLYRDGVPNWPVRSAQA